jgi:glycosyltransferase involved in cell wall biosynthesis
VKTIIEQTIAPRAIEDQILSEEHRRFPNWEQPAGGARAVQEMIAREEREWALADLIICASPFVRDGIKQRGGPAERCAVVPYGVDIMRSEPAAPPPGRRPLRVLTVGHVGLRKGAPYVLAVARALKGVADFRWVGPIQVSPGAAAEMSAHVEMVGAIPRGDVARHYEWADVFFLPSVCEGSATVTYEALSWGRPVVTTPGAGSPVRDGVDGYIVADRDSAAMADCITRLGSDPNLLGQLSQQARDGARALSLAAYKSRLLPLLAEAAR